MGDFREVRMSTDELTGLLDKQTFFVCAQNLIDTAHYGQEYAFIFFDVENFKIFNANYGYEIGDELLVSIAYILKDEFEGQLLAHFTGDHFVACVNTIQVIQTIKSVRERIKLIRKSASIELKAGIYIYDGEEKDVIKCCDKARMACISIKKNTMLVIVFTIRNWEEVFSVSRIYWIDWMRPLRSDISRSIISR
ncbi:diguanylate cyclase (GGDEF) domain [Butyrivibrio fibrisolvens 16/4]|nr:diguanylate cyclase (GGDEF) domain [Butyrivibrio fibrisolvens 16/4]